MKTTLLNCLKKSVGYFFLIAMGAIFVFPILWVILTSLKQPVDAFSIPPKWIFTPTFSHWVIVWTTQGFSKFLINSLTISLSSAAVITVVGSLAAYGFSRHKTKTSLLILLLLLALRMFPRELLGIPFYILAMNWQLYDTQIIMIAIYTAFNLTFAVWMLRGFFLGVPTDLDDAAMIDGCSRLGAFWRILLPNVLPGVVATFFLTFLYSWNEYQFALILTGPRAKTLPPAVGALSQAEVLEYWSWSAAGACGLIVPSIIIMLLIQKYLIEGLTFGIITKKKK